MAKMTMGGDDLKQKIADVGHITVCDPCVGAGGMMIAAAQACEEEGIDPKKSIHITCVDIDPLCVWMTYVQLELRGLPAVVILGDSLRMEFKEHWFTSAHVVDGWGRRLINGRAYEDVSWWRASPLAGRVAFIKRHGLDLSLAREAEPTPAMLQAAREEGPPAPAE